MYKIYFRAALLSILIGYASSLASYGQNPQSAGAYLDLLNNQQQKISEDMWDYTSTVAHGKNARKTEQRRKDLIKTILSAKSNISKLPGYENDGSLRDSMVSYLTMSYYVLNDDYSKIVDLEEIAEQSYDLMEAYMMAQQKANEKMEISGNMLEEQTRVFAKTHNINLLEGKDKLGKKLEIASHVFKYYNKAYLVFFKSYKQEAYLLDAIDKQNLNSIEQNKNALLSTAEEGLRMNDTIKLYKNDPSVKSACKLMLDFYKQEAKIKIPVIVDFYLKKEVFEKAKAAFDTKMEMARTKEDVDNMNKAIADFNKATVQYNQVNQELYNKRSNLLNTWNNTVQSFLDRHIPKK